MARPKRLETPEQRRSRLTENTRRYRRRHPERVKVSRKNVYDSRKKRALEMLGGSFCVNCGCDVLSFLEVNHINGKGWAEFKKYGNTSIDRILSGKRSTKGLNVLCRVCNALDHLKRKNGVKAGFFEIRWEEFSGKKAKKNGK